MATWVINIFFVQVFCVFLPSLIDLFYFSVLAISILYCAHLCIMYSCENWTLKEPECLRIEAFRSWCWRRLKSTLDCKEIKPEINPEYLLERLMLKLKLISVLWPCDVKSRLIGEDPDAGKDWRQKEKRVAGDEMVGWHHWLHGHEFEQTAGDGEGQGSLACCSPWGHKESDMT